MNDITDIIIQSTNFVSNSAASLGGGLAISTCIAVQILECEFTQNRVGSSGGGMSLSEITSLIIQRSIFTDNSASIHGGGVMSSNNNAIDISNSTFTKNQCRDSGCRGSAVMLEGCMATLLDNIFDSNSCPLGAGTVFYTNFTMDEPIGLVTGNLYHISVICKYTMLTAMVMPSLLTQER